MISSSQKMVKNSVKLSCLKADGHGCKKSRQMKASQNVVKPVKVERHSGTEGEESRPAGATLQEAAARSRTWSHCLGSRRLR